MRRRERVGRVPGRRVSCLDAIFFAEADTMSAGESRTAVTATSASGNATSALGSTNTMYKFKPKTPIRSFRDLEVYQKTLEGAVIFYKDVRPDLLKLKYDLLEGMTNCALSIPLFIAESHGMRFSDFKQAVATLEKAMRDCNKMIVYLEQAEGIYGTKISADLAEDLSRRYLDVRGKMFRLEKSWQKFRQADVQMAKFKK